MLIAADMLDRLLELGFGGGALLVLALLMRPLLTAHIRAAERISAAVLTLSHSVLGVQASQSEITDSLRRLILLQEQTLAHTTTLTSEIRKHHAA